MWVSKCACECVTAVCVPVVSNGGQPTEIDLLVFFEVQTSGWTLRCGDDLLLSTAVDVHYAHRGFVDSSSDINNDRAGRKTDDIHWNWNLFSLNIIQTILVQSCQLLRGLA